MASLGSWLVSGTSSSAPSDSVFGLLSPLFTVSHRYLTLLARRRDGHPRIEVTSEKGRGTTFTIMLLVDSPILEEEMKK